MSKNWKVADNDEIADIVKDLLEGDLDTDDVKVVNFDDDEVQSLEDVSLGDIADNDDIIVLVRDSDC